MQGCGNEPKNKSVPNSQFYEYILPGWKEDAELKRRSSLAEERILFGRPHKAMFLSKEILH